MTRDRPTLEQRAAYPGRKRSPTDADTRRVLQLRGQRMTLIEVRGGTLGIQIQPVLRDGDAVEADPGECRRRIIGGLPERVLRRSGQATAKPPPQQHLTGMTGGASVR